MNPGRPSKIDERYPDQDSLVRAVEQYGVRELARRIGCDRSAIYKRLKTQYGLRVQTIQRPQRRLVPAA